MIETVNVMKEEYVAVSRRHCLNCALNGKPINDACLRQITGTEAASGALFWNAFHEVIEGDNGQGALAQVHQNCIDGKPMKPSAEDRVSAE